MKTFLVIGMALVLATVALPSASASGEIGEPCGSGSLVNRVQYCANNVVDWTQQTAEEVFCDLVCDYAG